MMNIGKTIKLFRVQKGLTQKELSDLAGITLSYLSLLESGKRSLKLSTLSNICNSLDVPMIILLFAASDMDGEENSTLSNELIAMLAVELTRYLTKSKD